MDTIMAAQEHVALARSLFDLYNNRQSDPAWLDKSGTAFAADAEQAEKNRSMKKVLLEKEGHHANNTTHFL
ncbi:MAG TPA: hypothetical protein VF043_05920 [Ktedonobacteraceae bacterium]